MLGLPKPDPASPIHVDEEALFERFLQVWREAPDEERRSAPLDCWRRERAAMLGWADLVDEQIAEPVRQRLFRGELEEFPDHVRVSFMRVTNLVPEMFTWLSSATSSSAAVNRIVEGFERFLASRGLAPPPPRIGRPRSCSWTCPVSRRSRGSAETSPRSSPRRRSARGGRDRDPSRGQAGQAPGDGAMLRLADAAVGVSAALELVRR